MSDLHRHRILLVDNEPMLRETWTMVLNELGYDVAIAADALDALAQLRCAIPDIIISDLNMPRMSGFEFLKIMCVRFPKIPLVGLSGVYDSNDHFPRRVIVDAIYPKGRCNRAELGHIVADLLRATPARENPPASQPGPAQCRSSETDLAGEFPASNSSARNACDTFQSSSSRRSGQENKR